MSGAQSMPMPGPLAPPPMPPPALAAAQPAGRGHQTGFLQYRQPAFWLFVLLLAVGALSVLEEQLTYLSVYPTAWLLGLVLLVIYVAPVALAIYLLDIFEREPLSMVVAAFLWGGVVAIALAGPTNGAMGQIIAKIAGPDVAASWNAALTAPLVEETYKYLGLVLLFLIARNEWDDLLDGFIYGAFAGLGFATVENVYYFIVKGVHAGGGADQVGPVLFLYFLRVLLYGPYMHVLWTGLTGIGLAYFVTRRDQPFDRRLMVAAGLFALGVATHFLWNSPLLWQLYTMGFVGLVLLGLVKGAPFLIFLAILVRLGHQRENAWFQGMVGHEVGTDVITHEEMAQLRGLRGRWAARRAVGARKGPAGAKLMHELQRSQIQLGLMRSRSDRDDHPDLVAQRDRIRGLRAQLQGLPDIAPPATAYSPALAAPVAAPGFRPTHVVPASGMQAWDAPDPARPPVAMLAPGVQLQVTEQNGAWSKVLGSNGWTGWVDGRLLVAYA